MHETHSSSKISNECHKQRLKRVSYSSVVSRDIRIGKNNLEYSVLHLCNFID